MAQDEPAELRLPPRPDAAAHARRHVRDALLGWGLGHLLEPVLLLTSEIVTNALLHSGTELGVRVARDGAGVRVAVGDGSAVVPVRRRHSTTASTGRGVQLLETVADEWGVEPAADGGKAVWFRLLSLDRWQPRVGLAGLEL